MADAHVKPAWLEPAPTPADASPAKKRLSVAARPPAPPSASVMLVQFEHRWAYRLAWALVVAAHVGAIAAYDHEAFINSYILLGSKTEMAVQLLGLGASIRREIGVTLVATNRMLMAWHVYGAVQILLSSLWYRRLVFRFQGCKPRKPTPPSTRAGNGRRASAEGSQVTLPAWRRVLAVVRLALARVWAFYRSTGARGKHFDAAFDVRETVEIVSQTVQAYSISCLITNDSVLHFVALVLVLNCWSTPVLRFAFKAHEAKKRLLCFAVDAVFDFCSALAIPFLTFSLWERQVATLDFFDAVWLVRSSTLLQYNLVNTWQGVVTTRLPALGLVFALETLKSLLHRHGETPPPPLVRQQQAPPVVTTNSNTSSRDPEEAATTQQTGKVGPHAGAVPAKHASRFTKTIDLVFFVYGLVVLVLHTKAMAEPAIDRDARSGCWLQLRPWGRRKAQCAVLDIDCARLGITGKADEIAAAIDAFDAGVVASATVANCAALEMPATIQRLARLLHLEVYNSTLQSWGAQAALTTDAHPVLTSLVLVNVTNVASGLPPGLLSPQFPPSLRVVQIIGGDLQRLASSAADAAAIQSHWPATMFVFAVEQTPLDAFPSLLRTRQITQTLSLAANKLTAVPAEVFFSSVSSTIVRLGGNAIAALPADASTANAGYSRVTAHLEATAVRDVPPWIASLFATVSSAPALYAGGSPLCTEASLAPPPSFVNCDPSAEPTYFPLEAYDRRRRVRST